MRSEVEKLIRGGTKDPGVDERRGCKCAARWFVDGAAPARPAELAEPMPVMRDQQRLRFAVPDLLPEKCAQCSAPRMPDHGAGMKGNSVPMVEQAPAEVDIVARSAIALVEPSDFLPDETPDGQVAAGKVLGVECR